MTAFKVTLADEPTQLLEALADAHPGYIDLSTAGVLVHSAPLLISLGFAGRGGPYPRRLWITTEGLRVWRKARYPLWTRYCLGVAEAERSVRRRARGQAA